LSAAGVAAVIVAAVPVAAAIAAAAVAQQQDQDDDPPPVVTEAHVIVAAHNSYLPGFFERLTAHVPWYSAAGKMCGGSACPAAGKFLLPLDKDGMLL
jgi:hypothetical protein